jgi:hypothetical protein
MTDLTSAFSGSLSCKYKLQILYGRVKQIDSVSSYLQFTYSDDKLVHNGLLGRNNIIN